MTFKFNGVGLAVAVLVSVMVWGSAGAAAFGQDDVDISGTTAADASLDVETLRIKLHPLQLEQLEVEASAWLAVLESKVREHSDVQIQARSMEDGEARTALQEQAASLKTESNALAEKADVVLDILESRGGDVETHRKYVDGVAASAVDVTNIADLGETSASLKEWFQTNVVDWVKDPKGGIAYGVNVLVFIVVLFVVWIVARIVGAIVHRAVARVKRSSDLLREFLVGLSRKVVLLIGFVFALQFIGVDMTPLIAGIGAAGLILGFALQGTLSNFASGIMILMYRPFDVGDGVEVAGVSGKVEAMTMVSTTLVTFDNQRLIVPNNEIWGSVIKNITGNPTRRVDMVFGIGYGDDIEKAEQVLTEIVKGHPMVHQDPAPVIKLFELADSSVNFVVRPWCNTPDYWNVYWDVTKQVKSRFDAENISIPFPQQDVHMHQVD